MSGIVFGLNQRIDAVDVGGERRIAGFGDGKGLVAGIEAMSP
jgi:hypothetical protein